MFLVNHISKSVLFLLLTLYGFCYPISGLANEPVDYRFERLWPSITQAWYFDGPRDLAVTSDGSFYVADTANHRIQYFNAQGELILSWGEEGAGNGQFYNPSGIDVDADGNIYVADTNNHRIQKFSANGEFIRKWGSEGSSNGRFSYPYHLSIGIDGSIYVADLNNHRIQQFNSNGQFIRTWGAEGNKNGQFNNPSSIAISRAGDVYVADTFNHRIQQFDAEGNFVRTWGSQGSSNSQFNEPRGIAIDAVGRVYVADFNNRRVQIFSADGVFNQVWSNGLSYTPSRLQFAPDGQFYIVDEDNAGIHLYSDQGIFMQTLGAKGTTNGKFKTPYAIAVAADSNVYITDQSNHRVQQFNGQGDYVRSWGESGSSNGSFNEPTGITVSADNLVYVVDKFNHRIQQFTTLGTFVRTWGSNGSNSGQFKMPEGIAAAPDGTVYVADRGNNRVQQFDAQGKFIRKWGSEGSGNGQFEGPVGIAIDDDGFVYVSESRNNRIQKFTNQGNFVQVIGRSGESEGQFSNPVGLTLTADGSLYIADAGHHRIQQFSSDGEFIRVLGSAGSGEGQFYTPNGIAASSDGSLYVVDSDNNRIQKFSPGIKTLSTANTSITTPYKAIILAGGGEVIGDRVNNIWDGTWRVSQKAYKALAKQGFKIHDEIKFLTAGSTEIDLDNNNLFDDLELATKASLQSAITEWAKNAEDVVIFLANHGGPGKFQINRSEVLSGEELKNWVTELDNSIPGHVAVIIEACNSASFFSDLSVADRYLFASASANQPAVISNKGLTSFSYYLWSEVSTGSILKESFVTARQAMSSVSLGTEHQNAQADTDGDQLYQQQDLTVLGEYCLGNCNSTAGVPPDILSVTPSEQTLNGTTALDFSVSVSHLQPLLSVWALVQRPDDMSIDPNEPLDLEKIILDCNVNSLCQGRYEQFDKQGDYRFSFYAMDNQNEVSSPDIVTITQNVGTSVIPAQYDETRTTAYLRDVNVDNQHYQVILELQGDRFVVTYANTASTQYTPAATFDFASGLLNIPEILVFGSRYQATLQHIGNLQFQLLSAQPVN